MMELKGKFQHRFPGFELDAAFTMPMEGVTVLFGPSGCGKSTILRCIAGLEEEASGDLDVAGTLWQSASFAMMPHERPLGFVFQDASLFEHLTVRGNLLFGAKRRPERPQDPSFDQVLQWLRLGTLLDRTVHGLSGGEKQRVAIGRALLSHPQLLLMDEPLSSLDRETRLEILSVLQGLGKEIKIPILYVTHSSEELFRLADHLLLMKGGRIFAQGDPVELLSRLDLPPAHAPDAYALVKGRVLHYDLDEELAELCLEAGSRGSSINTDSSTQTLFLTTPPLAVGSQRRLRIQARDVSLSLSRPENTSILNLVSATILSMSDEGGGQVLVQLDCAGVPLLSRITRRSSHQLNLKPGLPVIAQIKGVALE